MPKRKTAFCAIANQPAKMNYKQLLLRSFTWRSVNYLSVFLLNLAIARSFGAAGSGKINYLVTLLSMVLLLVSANLESSLTYFRLAKKMASQQLVTFLLAWVILVSVVFYWLLPALSRLSPLLPEFSLGAWPVFFLTGMLLYSYYTALFYGIQHFKYPNLLAFVFNLASILYLTIGVNKPTGQEFLPFWFGLTLAQGLCTMVAYHFYLGERIHLCWPTKTQLREMGRYSGYALLASLLFFILYRADYWLIVHLDKSSETLKSLGNYIQVSKLSHSLLLFSSMLGSAVFTGTADRNPRQDIALLGTLIRLICYLGVLIFLVVWLFGRFLFAELYGQSFEMMYPVFLLVFPGCVALMTVSITSNYLSALNQLQQNVKGVALGVAVIVLLDVLFIPLYGIYAAAAVSSIGYLVYAFFLLHQFSKHYTGSWRSILNYRQDLAFFRQRFQKGKA